VDFSAWWEMIPLGKLVALQSNNLDLPEHVNKSDTLDEFLKLVPLSRLLYKGELLVSGYKRFMIIGHK
jgi:hypothetical protein